MRLLSVLLFLLLPQPFPCSAQQGIDSRLDSNLALLAQARDDTNKVLLYTEIINGYYSLSRHEEGLKSGAAALELAERLAWKPGIVKVRTKLGLIYWRSGRFKEALTHHLAALEIAERERFASSIPSLLQMIAHDYADDGRYPEARKYLSRALAMYQQSGMKQEIAGMYQLSAWLYDNQGNLPEATRENYRSLAIYEEIGDAYGAAIATMNLSENLVDLGKYAEALRCLLTSLQPLKDAGDMINLGSTYNTIGSIHVLLGNEQEALRYRRMAYSLGKNIDDKTLMAESYLGMGDIYFNQGDIAGALNSFLPAVEWYEQGGFNTTSLAGVYRRIGVCYARLGRFGKAEQYLDRLRSLLRRIDSSPIRTEYYRGIEVLDSARGDWKAAYRHFKLYIVNRDSLFNKANTEKIVQMQMQYAFDQKEAVAKAEQERKDAETRMEMHRQNLVKYSALAGLILLVIFSLILYKRFVDKRKANVILTRTLEELRSTQLQLLQSEKMAAFGVMATRMAHEIHNPLNFVNNFSDLSQGLVAEVLSGKTDDDKRDAAQELVTNLQRIHHHGTRARDIINALQDHARAGTAHEFFAEGARPR